MLSQRSMSAKFQFRLAAVLVLTAGLATILAGCGANVNGGSASPAPQVSLSATTLTFSNTYIGLSSPAQTLTVTNSGNATLTISNIAISGDYSQTSSGCSSVSAGSTCLIAVTFTPTAIGTRTGALTLTTNAGTGTQTVNLTGTAAVGTPVVSLSSSALTFAATVVTTTSAAQSVTVTNTGTAALTISSVMASGDFATSSNGCTVTLPINGTCTIAVTFTPTTTGSRTGSLTLASNANPGTQMVSLTGTGLPGTPVVTVSAIALTFSTIVTGSSSSPQNVVVTNTGTAALSISSITISGDFSQTSTGCGVSLAINATCSVAVTFKPTLAGTRTGTLTIASNAPAATTVALTGTGQAPAPVPTLGLSASALNFGTQVIATPSTAQTITVTNIGTGTLTISSITASGDFSQSSSGCGAGLTANATCTITVIFTPTTAGERAGTLTIASNSTTTTPPVALTGEGYASNSVAGRSFNVLVQAGTAPIAGAAVQLYASGTTGNGSAPTALFSAPVIASASGIASLSGYYCPSATSLLYAVASGGTVAGASSPNPNIALMVPLGACNGIVFRTTYTADEATTIAAAEALAQFYALGGSIGSTATNSVGLTNAFATAQSLADPVAGTSPGSTLPANAVSPAPRLNSLANILNACVVSASSCATLYTATAQGSTQASNTLDAAYYIAKAPAANVAALYALSLAGTAYTPVLSQIPTDWTMFVTYSGGGLDSPSGLGVDSTGAVWVASYFGSASKFTPVGAPVFANGITGAGLNNSYGLAIDLSNNVWIPNEQPFTSYGIGTVSELASTGASLAGSGYATGGMNYPISVAIDPNGTVWVVDYGNSYLSILNTTGNAASSAPSDSPRRSSPSPLSVVGRRQPLCLDRERQRAVPTNVTKISPGRLQPIVNYITAATLHIRHGHRPEAITSGPPITTTTTCRYLTRTPETSSQRKLHRASAPSTRPQGIADRRRRHHLGRQLPRNHTSMNSRVRTLPLPGAALSPAAGLGTDAGLLEAYAIAIDASGNLWISNQGNNTITRFIGLAAPVKNSPLRPSPNFHKY